MRAFKVPGTEPSKSVATPSNLKRRLLIQGFLAILVLVAIGTLFFKSKQSPTSQLPLGEISVTQSVDLPEIDSASIDLLVADDSPESRVLLEGKAIDTLAPTARNLTSAHVRAFDATVLDDEASTALEARRHAARGEVFTARGYIADMRERQRGPGNRVEYIGRLILTDESSVYFLAFSNPEHLFVGDFARIDGLFMKMWSNEDLDELGTWVDGPLLLAPRLHRSYSDVGLVTRLDPKVSALVEDDYLLNEDGSPGRWKGIPRDGLWHLMAYARDMPDDAIDWATVPELDRESLRAAATEGAPHRFQPYRIPISRLQGIRVRAGIENPARIEEFTTGWIGNTMWKNVLHFQAPKAYGDLGTSNHITARGFFLSNFAYESVSGMRLAPVFVLQSLDLHDPGLPYFYAIFGRVIVGVIIGLMLLFFVILRRDGARSRQLQDDLVRRRRQRRAKNLALDAGGS